MFGEWRFWNATPPHTGRPKEYAELKSLGDIKAYLRKVCRFLPSPQKRRNGSPDENKKTGKPATGLDLTIASRVIKKSFINIFVSGALASSANLAAGEEEGTERSGAREPIRLIESMSDCVGDSRN